MQTSLRVGLEGKRFVVLFFCNRRFFFVCQQYTVKLARAKLLANAGNFTCSSQVKRSLAQFTCDTCSLPVNAGNFTCFEAASTSRRTNANCLRAHVNLPEYHRHFTGSFTCGTHAGEVTCNFRALLTAIACILREVLAA